MFLRQSLPLLFSSRWTGKPTNTSLANSLLNRDNWIWILAQLSRLDCLNICATEETKFYTESLTHLWATRFFRDPGWTFCASVPLLWNENKGASQVMRRERQVPVKCFPEESGRWMLGSNLSGIEHTKPTRLSPQGTMLAFRIWVSA